MKPDQAKKIELVANKNPNFFFSDKYDFGSYEKDLKPIKEATEQAAKELAQISGALGVNQTGSILEANPNINLPTLKNYNVEVINEFKDPIRERVKNINNRYVYTFEFDKSKDMQNLFDGLKLSSTGKNINKTVPNFIYKGIEENVLKKIYNDFVFVFGEDFTNVISNKEQLFENIFDGFSIRTLDKNKKQKFDSLSSDFNNSKNAVISAILKEIYKNPNLIAQDDLKGFLERPKLLAVSKQENDFYTNKIKVNQKKLKDYTANASKVSLIGFVSLLEDFIINDADEESRNILEYINLVSKQFKVLLEYILFPFSGPQPSYLKNKFLTYEDKCITDDPGQCRYVTNKNGVPFTSKGSNTIENLNNLVFNQFDFSFKSLNDSYNSSNLQELKDDTFSVEEIKTKIKSLEERQKILDFINAFKGVINFVPSNVYITSQSYVYLAIDPDPVTDNISIRQQLQNLYDLLIKPIEDYIFAYETNEGFDNYYKLFFKNKEEKVDPYIKIIKNLNIKYPSYKYIEGLLYPKFYGPCPNLEVSLLYNKKTDLYLNKDPKILFSFEEPKVLSFDKIEEPINNTNGFGNYTPSKQQKYLNSIQPNTIFIYKSEEEIINLKNNLVSNKFLKKLDVKKQTSFYENLEPNKDYYYFYVAEYGANKDPSSQIIHDYKGTYFIIINDDLYYICSSIMKIRLVKDGNFYYLEKETFIMNNKGNIQKEFKEKVKFVPDSNFFQFGTNGFQNNNPYIKVRVTSKKTRKKVDLNLKYTINKNAKEVDDYDLSKLENIDEMSDVVLQKKIQEKIPHKEITNNLETLAKTQKSVQDFISNKNLGIFDVFK